VFSSILLFLNESHPSSNIYALCQCRGVKDAKSTAMEVMQGTEQSDQNASRLEDRSVPELQMGSLPANVSSLHCPKDILVTF
jgi:hypothetical protein